MADIDESAAGRGFKFGGLDLISVGAAGQIAKVVTAGGSVCDRSSKGQNRHPRGAGGSESPYEEIRRALPLDRQHRPTLTGLPIGPPAPFTHPTRSDRVAPPFQRDRLGCFVPVIQAASVRDSFVKGPAMNRLLAKAPWSEGRHLSQCNQKQTRY